MPATRSAIRPILGGLETVNALGNSGASKTIDLALGNFVSTTLTADCTFTFSGATSGKECAFTLELTQDGTGSRTVSWPGSVSWPGASAPTLATAAGSVDVVTFYTADGGTNWRGFHVTRAAGASGAITSSGLTMATARLLGRTTASSGAIEEITVGSGLSLSAGALTATGSSSPIASGTSNPGSPSNNDIFYRTDLDKLIFYDGTRWLSLTRFRQPMTPEVVMPLSASSSFARWVGSDGTQDYWIEGIEFISYHASPTGTNFWDLQAIKGTAAESESNVGSNPVTSSDTSNNWTRHDVTVGAALGTTNRYIRATAIKHAAGANIYVHAAVVYREIIA